MEVFIKHNLNLYMYICNILIIVRQCIAPIYDPRPRSKEVRSSITLELEGQRY